MTAPRDPQASRDFHEAMGGETISERTVPGPGFIVTALPIPDGTVRVAVVLATASGPFGVQIVVTADQAKRMGELLERVASR